MIRVPPVRIELPTLDLGDRAGAIVRALVCGGVVPALAADDRDRRRLIARLSPAPVRLIQLRVPDMLAISANWTYR